MVQIPRADVSRGTLTTQTTSNQIQDIDSFTANARALERAGQVLGQVADEFKRLDTLRAVSRATVEINTGLTELEDRYLSDPNLTESSAARYQQEAQEFINTRLAEIPDETARLNAGVQFQGTSLVKGFNIKRQGRQADILNAGIENQAVVEQALKDSWASVTEEERAIVRNNLAVHFNNQMAARLADAPGVNKALTEFDEKVRKGRASFQRQAMTVATPGRTRRERILNAELFIEQVNKGDYPELTSDEQQEEVAAAQQFIARESQIAANEEKEQRYQNTVTDLPKMLGGEIPPEQISEKMLYGEYEEGLAKDIIAHLKSYKAPVGDSEVNIPEVSRVEQQIYGMTKKQVFLDENGKEIGMGFREDNTAKGIGYYGPIVSADGTFSTEVSVGVEIEGKKQSIPLLIPGLTAEEINVALKAAREDVTGPEVDILQNVIQKATAHAVERIQAGQSPFADVGEQIQPPAGITAGKFSVGYRDFTKDELLSDIVRTTNGNFSTSISKSLIEKVLSDLPQQRKDFVGKELNRIKDAMLADIGGEGELAPQRIRSIIDTMVHEATAQIDALKTYDEGQIKTITDRVYRKWVTTPAEFGGLGITNIDAEDLPPYVIKDGEKMRLWGIKEGESGRTDIKLQK